MNPTSEFIQTFINHLIMEEQANGSDRVAYHLKQVTDFNLTAEQLAEVMHLTYFNHIMEIV